LLANAEALKRGIDAPAAGTRNVQFALHIVKRILPNRSLPPGYA
jgi:hypothetical protein